MLKKDCFELGTVARLHGYSGDVVAHIDADDPSRYKHIEVVLIELKGELVPFGIKSNRINGNQAILRLEGVTTEEQALGLKGKTLWLPLHALPALESHQFYYHDIVGFTVQDEQLGALGTVEAVYTMPHQDLIAMDYKETEVLIPVTNDIVLRADMANRLLVTRLPEGLLDIYLDQEPSPDDEDRED